MSGPDNFAGQGAIAVTALAVVALITCIVGNSLIPLLPIAATAWVVWTVAMAMSDR